MSWRRGNIKIYAFFTAPISPWSKNFALSRVKSQSVDIVGRGPSSHSDNEIIFEENLFPFDLILENIMDASMQDSAPFFAISDIKCPNKALVDDFNHFWESRDVGIVKESALVDVAKRPCLKTMAFDCHGELFRFGSVEGRLRLFGGDNAVGEVGEAIPTRSW